MSVVTDFVEDVFDTAGDILEEAGDFIGDVVEVVGDVVEGALDDPIGTIASVAAIAAGQYWALPLISGANVAINGGDLGDIVTAMAVSYVAGEVGSYVGEAAGQYAASTAAAAEYGLSVGSQQAIQLGVQEAFSGLGTVADIASAVVGGAAASASVAVVTGQDPVQAFVTGGVSSAVPALLGKVKNFEKLNNTSQNVINSAVTAGLTGSNVTSATIASLVSSASITTDIVNNLSDQAGGTLTPAQQALITQAVASTAAAAFAGGDPSTAFQNSLVRFGTKDLGDKLTSPEFWEDAQEFLGLGEKITSTASLIQDNEAQQDAIKEKHNALVSTITTRQENQAKLKATMDAARKKYENDKTQANFDAANKATEAYNDYTTKLNNDFNSIYKDQLQGWSDEFDMLKEEHTYLVEEWDGYQEKFLIETDRMDETILRPLYDTASEFFVSEMDPDFDESAYKALNNLGNDVNGYQHWLESGQFSGLPTNWDDAALAYEGNRTRLIQGILADQGLSLSTASEQTLSEVYQLVNDEYQKNNSLFNTNFAGIATDSNGLRDRLANDQSFADAVAETQLREGVVINKPITYEKTQDGMISGWSPEQGWKIASQEEVLDGGARLTVTDKGKLVYITPGDDAGQSWIPSLGTFVDDKDIFIGSGSGGGSDAPYVNIYETPPGGVSVPPGSVPAGLDTAPSMRDLWDMDPEAYLVTAAETPVELATVKGIDEFFIRMAQSAITAAENTGNEGLLSLTTAAIRVGGSAVAQVGGTLALLTGDIPKDSDIWKFGNALVELGEASNSEQYAERLANLDYDLAEAKKAGDFWDVALATGQAIIDNPGIFAQEYIGVNLMQEIIPYALGGVVGTGVKGYLLARGAAQEVAEKLAMRAGLGTALTVDMMESAVETADETYDTVYILATNNGFSESQADEMARTDALKAAGVAAMTTAVANKVGGAAFEKMLFGNKTGNMDAAERVYDIFTRTLSETASEGAEEAFIKNYQEGLYSVIDPSRDSTSEVAQAMTLGALTGGGVTSTGTISIHAGQAVTTAILNSKGVNDVINNSANIDEANEGLKLLGLDDNPYVKAAVYNGIDPSSYGSIQDINVAMSNAIEQETGLPAGAYTYSDEDFANFVGIKTPDLNTAAQEYIDTRYTNFSEAKSYLESVGYINPTNEEVNQFVKAAQESETELLMREFADPLVTDYEEAQKFLTDLGYTDARDAEINRFVGKFAEDDSQEKIAAYVDPRQVTEAEARQFFEDLGYTPTSDELAQFTRHGWTVNQNRVETELGEYVDPRFVDIDEVREAYEALGLSRPTQADLEKFVGQYDESELAGKAEEYLPTGRYNSIVELIDNLAAQQGATPEVLEALGTVKDDLQKQIEDLGFVIDEATGTVLSEMQATENRLTDLIEANEAAGMERDEAIQSAVDALATDLGTTREDILDQLEENRSDLLSEIEGLGTQISDLEKTLLDEIAANEEAGMSRDEALDAAIAAVADDLGTTRDDLLDQLGTTESNLLEEMSALEERVGEQVSGVEKTLLDQIAANEAAGMERDEAIQAAINDVAIDLGTTKEALLDQLGTTEQALIDRITSSETALGEQIGTVEQNLLDQMALYEEAGIERDVALGMAIDNVSEELGITRDALLDQIGLTEQELSTRIAESEAALSEQITGVETNLTQQIQDVADILGKPYTDVTQADIDFVNELIAQQEAEPEMALTPEQLAYDYNGDGVIDNADLFALQTQFGITQGTIDPTLQPDFTFEPEIESLWSKPTGVFADIADLEELELQGQREQAYRDFLMMGGLQDQKVTVNTPQEGAKIGPAYDWSSIFANPEQAKFYGGFSPYGAYAEGGTVEDLLKLLGDK